MPHGSATDNVHAVELFEQTGTLHVDSILSGFRYSAEQDGDFEVTYSVAEEGALFDDHYVRDGVELTDSFFPVPDELVTYFEAAVADVERFTNLQLTQVIEDGAQFGEIRLAGTEGLPSNVGAMVFRRTDVLDQNQTGDIWFDDRAFTDGFEGISEGLLQRAMFHEFGHALGLNHPGEGFQTVQMSGIAMPIEFDGDEYTVMDPTFDSALFRNATVSDLEPSNFGYIDILALQSLYGVNETATAGNDVYSFNLSERHYQTIYDLGGKDTIEVLSTSGNLADDSVNIDLSSETDSLGGRFIDVGTLVTYYGENGEVVGTNANTVYVTPETIIENVFTVGGNDFIRGNSADNLLSGNAGVDTLAGGAGNDTLDGGDGDDFLRGDAGSDWLKTGSGNDIAYAGPSDDSDDTVEGNAGDDLIGAGVGNDLIVGGDIGDSITESNVQAAGSDTLFGGAGDDILVGGSYNIQTNTAVDSGAGNNVIFSGTGSDTIFGDSGADELGGGSGGDNISGSDGNDTIYGGRGMPSDNADTLSGGSGDDIIFASNDTDQVDGGAGDDTLYGGNAADTVEGGGGADIMFGGSGTDQIHGGTGNDTLYGGNEADTVNGGAGNDIIRGGAGDDILAGAEGADTFVFATGFGNDSISDFGTSGSDIDILDFSGIEGLDLDELLATATFSDGDATLTIGMHGTLHLVGIDALELQVIFDAGQVLLM